MESCVIQSRDNPLLRKLRRLSEHPGAYRELGWVWVEGEHLCRAALQRGLQPHTVLLAESQPHGVDDWGLAAGVRRVLLAERLWASLSALESPGAVGFLLALPPVPALQGDRPTVVLDRLQDPGNVGAILRSAAAFGFTQVLALKGTTALWAPKVLRAGMGAHFGLQLHEGAGSAELAALAAVGLPLLATSSHQGQYLHQSVLPWPCAWAFGHEGQGLSPALLQGASRSLRIAQPGGEESLNVAAAAAICLHASAAQRLCQHLA